MFNNASMKESQQSALMDSLQILQLKELRNWSQREKKCPTVFYIHLGMINFNGCYQTENWLREKAQQ